MIEEDTEIPSLLSSDFVDLSWMTSDDFKIRTDTVLYLQKEVKTNFALRVILRELTLFARGKKIKHGPRYNSTDMLINEFKKVARGNSNILLHIFGKTNSGKSMLAQKLAFLLRKEYRDYGREVPDHPRANEYLNSKVVVVFRVEEANREIQKMEPGGILLRDEQSKTSGQGSQIENDANENLRKAVRGMNINFFDAQPNPDLSLNLNFNIFTIGYHVESEITIAILYTPMPSTNMKSSILNPTGYLLLKKHTDLDFIREYESRKMDYIQSLQETGGQETVSLKKHLIKQDAAALISYIKNNEDGISIPKKASQKHWDLAFSFSNVNARSTAHNARVISYAQMLFENKLGSDEKIEAVEEPLFQLMEHDNPMLQFDFDLMGTLKKYSDESKKKIYLDKIESELKNTELAIKYNCSAQWIGQVLKAVDAFLDFHMGHAFEIHARQVYEGAGYEILSGEGLAHIGDPDLVVQKDGLIEVVSLKCSRSIRTTINPIKDLAPEIAYYKQLQKEGRNAELYLEFINTMTGEHRKQTLSLNSLAFIKTIPLY